jgi:hypothetical protein
MSRTAGPRFSLVGFMMILLFDRSVLKADSCRGVRFSSVLFLFLVMISCYFSLRAFSKLVMWFSM